MYEYFHWNGSFFVVRGIVRASDDIEAFKKACAKLKLLHPGNIAVQKVSQNEPH